MAAVNVLDPAHAHPLPRPASGRLLGYLPRGNLLDDEAWLKRHTLLRWLLLLHAPAIAGFGWWRGYAPITCLTVTAPILACLLMGTVVQRRRLASFFITAGLVYCSSALVGLSGGMIEAHFHFFIIIGFIALYQDWVPFLWNILFTVLSHGLGSAWSATLIFNHPAAQQNPWLWSLIHGLAVLAACVGMVIFWRYSEDEMNKSITLRTAMTQAELDRRRFTSDLLVNLARRNQSMLHLQLGIINQLEDAERDPDALAELFRLDHLATRIRRNAESLLVLSGEEPQRVWSRPVRLRDVVRAAIAETEDLNRVDFEVEAEPAVHGRLVTGLTHLLAELVENAVHFSSPSTRVTVRVRPDPRSPGTRVITVEDWGLGMPAADLDAANRLLSEPPDVDLSTSQRYGLHVVSRLAKRFGIRVQLTPTANGGLTAVVVLPPTLFVTVDPWSDLAAPEPAYELVRPRRAVPRPGRADRLGHDRGTPDRGAAELVAAELAAPDRVAAERVTPDRGRPDPVTAPPAADAARTDLLEIDLRDGAGLDNPGARVSALQVPTRRESARHPSAQQVSPPWSVAPEPAVNFGIDVRDDGWRGWWDDVAIDQDPASPELASAFAPPPSHHPGVAPPPSPPTAIPPVGLPMRGPIPGPIPDPTIAGVEGSLLARRTPQSHLAPELRRAPGDGARQGDPGAITARDALSHYQARRREALATADHERRGAGPGAGPTGPPGGFGD